MNKNAVGVNDRLFDVGLNSLSAMKLAHELKINVSDLIREQTIARLAKLMTGDALDEPVVKLSKGTGNRGVVVLVHSPSGSLGPLRELGKRVEVALRHVEVFGAHLVPKMLIKSVAQLAGLYISSLKKQCSSSGPFLILGCDVAGAIAYEMAHQLTRSGDEVSKLVLIGRPFFDERCYASPEKDALAIVSSEKTSDKQKLVEVWSTIARLCLSYAKKKSSLLPCTASLFIDAAFVEDGMDEILQQTLFRQCATTVYDGTQVLGCLIENASTLRQSHHRWETTKSIIGMFYYFFVQKKTLRAVVAMKAASELLLLSGSQHHGRLLGQSLSQSRNSMSASSMGLRASVLGVSQLQVWQESFFEVPSLYFFQLEQSTVTNTTLLQMQHDIELPLSFLSKADGLSSPPPLSPSSKGGVLLTGATGFIGHYVLGHILRSFPLVKVYVIVRGEAERIAQDDRVKVLVGDLGRPMLGVKVACVHRLFLLPIIVLQDFQWNELVESVDYVVHNGAYVNHVMEYKEMRSVNVLGIIEVLKLCATGSHKKRLVMVSTTGVVPVLPGETPETPAKESTTLATAEDQVSPVPISPIFVLTNRLFCRNRAIVKPSTLQSSCACERRRAFL